MPRGKNCCETIFAAQLPRNYPHRGGNFEEEKKPSLVGERGNVGGISRDKLGVGNCESKIAARQWRVNICREASRCLAASGSGDPKRAFWDDFPGLMRTAKVDIGCKISWPFFSRKPPALTSINRRKSAINPEIASINVC